MSEDIKLSLADCCRNAAVIIGGTLANALNEAADKLDSLDEKIQAAYEKGYWDGVERADRDTAEVMGIPYDE